MRNLFTIVFLISLLTGCAANGIRPVVNLTVPMPWHVKVNDIVLNHENVRNLDVGVLPFWNFDPSKANDLTVLLQRSLRDTKVGSQATKASLTVSIEKYMQVIGQMHSGAMAKIHWRLEDMERGLILQEGKFYVARTASAFDAMRIGELILDTVGTRITQSIFDMVNNSIQETQVEGSYNSFKLARASVPEELTASVVISLYISSQTTALDWSWVE